MATGGHYGGQRSLDPMMSKQEGVKRFSLNVNIVRPSGLNNSERETICGFVNLHLATFVSDSVHVLDKPCLHICERFTVSKNNVSLEIAVNNRDDLNNFFSITKKLPEKDISILSACMTEYFQKLQMPRQCALYPLKDIVTFKFVMHKEKYDKVLKKLKTCSSSSEPTTDNSVPDGPETKVMRVMKTFIINVQEELHETITLVRIKSDALKELNRDMTSLPFNMFELVVPLPVDYNPGYRYSYEIHIKKAGWVMSSNTKWQSSMFALGNSAVNRDLLPKRPNSGLSGQLLDIIHNTKHFSQSDLMHQGNNLCKKGLNSEAKDCVKAVLSNPVPDDEHSATRFIEILCWLTAKFDEGMNVDINAAQAENVISRLRNRTLSDFSEATQACLPMLCKSLWKVIYVTGYTMYDFIDYFWTFLGEHAILKLLRDSIKKREEIIQAHYPEKVLGRIEYLIKMHIETGDTAFRDLLDIFIRHYPTDHVIQMVCKIKEACSHKDDLLNVLITCSRSNILSGINRAKCDKHLIELLNLATYEAQMGFEDEDETLLKALQDSILDLYSSNIKLSSDTLLKATVECLHNSRCFRESMERTKLIETIVESSSSTVRQLLNPLLDESTLSDTFDSLDVSLYTKWLQHEFNNNPNHRVDEIAYNLHLLIVIINKPVIAKRSDICNALEGVTVRSLRKYNLREHIQCIAKVDKLHENAPDVVGLFEKQVKQLLPKDGRKPHEVLLHFCYNEQLSLNYRTTSELVCSTIDMFFKEELGKSCCEIFLSQIKHVEFWQILDKADGLFNSSVYTNKTFSSVMKALKDFVNILELEELNIFQYSLIIDQCYNAKALLKLGGMTDGAITKCLKSFKAYIEESKNRLSVTLSVLPAIQKRNISNAPDLENILSSVKEISEKMESGNVSIKECKSIKWQWGDLEYVPSICQSVHTLVESEVFWNASSEDMQKSHEENRLLGSELKNLLYVRFLYQPSSYDLDVDILEVTQDAVGFLSYVENIGIKKYNEFWEILETNPNVKMVYVIEMFKHANVPKELAIANRFLKKRVTERVYNTLMQIWKTKDAIHATNAIESVINVLGYNIHDSSSLQKDLVSFKELTSNKVDDYRFCDIQKALTHIFSLTSSLSEETIAIMDEMGKSKQLIEFLQEIAIDDIRNLIDAVEDIAESHVQESTVSALIEIKRFLGPLLSPTCENIDNQWVFTTLEKQTQTRKEYAIGIPAKISDCTDNLHNLKSLYNNVANRGQQTKEIIKSVVTKGEFVFVLDPNKEVVTYTVQYKDNKNKYEKQETTLLDIRSRALLLLNTERQSTESGFNADEFRSFIYSIDLCIDIRDTLLELYTSGHIRYTNYKRKLSIKALQEIKVSLKDDLNIWTIQIKGIREEYYLMNFITGSQIHTLNKFLKNGCLDAGVPAVLKFIHPELSTDSLIHAYKGERSSQDDDIEVMARSIHSAFAELGLFYRSMECSDCAKKIGDHVQEGSVSVSQLDECSNYAIKTILALYHNTTHQLPEPNQLLFCSPDTKWCEIELLLERCIGSLEFYGSMPLYCLANVEKLQNEVQFKLVDELQKLKLGSKFLLAVVCRGNKNHPFVDRLSENVGVIQPMSDVSLEYMLESKFPYVQTYTSEVAGLGKTSQINKDAAKRNLSTLTLHVSGNFRRNILVQHLMNLKMHAFHVLLLDIGSVDDLDELDVFLFELIVLKFVSAGKGAFHLSTANVCLEIANSINNSLRNALLVATSFKRVHMEWHGFDDFLPSMEVNSPVQVVCNYLNALDLGQLDQKDLKFSGNGKLTILSAHQCRQLLKKHMVMTSDISFSIVHIFLSVLAEQLKKLSCSSFFKVSRITDMIGQNEVPTVRSNLVKSMIEVSKEFASRSVNACRSEQSTTLSYEAAVELSSTDLAKSAVDRVNGMIRWEESNHLIYVFHNQNIQTLSAMYCDKSKVPGHLRKMFETQMNKKLPDFSQMKQIELQHILQRVARRQSKPLSEQKLAELSSDYALTPDNLLKMVLIMMRVQSRVPIVIMGETGCGKTSLIRYLASICDVPFRVMNIHAGTSHDDVIDTVRKCNSNCIETPGKQSWLFLDEINTSENIGLICDTICHRKCNGADLMPNLIIMGACNPYKLRTTETIKTAGLTGKVKTDDLSKLVYRVLPLPEMMVDYVWDFGSLNENDEVLYIERMIEGVNGDPHTRKLLRDLLSVSQRFVRKQERSTCVVSLRDVQRCKTLFCWFESVLKQKNKTQAKINSYKPMILALAHCYHSRFIDKGVRQKYREVLAQQMNRNDEHITADSIYDIIKEEQMNILDRMDLPAGTAKNSALQENIFVILVCILNKIPIFVVGKPGCSKSLAMQVIRSNLRGKDSKDHFFKTLPQLYCVSFQGSESSTSDGIKKVFEKAENYQNSNVKDDVLSVVILDEIGLAEVSRFNPLKVLHSLLEPEGRSRPNVAVVGISNWALDASKMNRAIHLSRPDMDEDELFETAVSISKSFTLSIQTDQRGLSLNPTSIHLDMNEIDDELRLIAQSYISYTKQLQFKHFHGLRDFYSLVKFVARRITQENTQPVASEKKTDIIMEGLQRNFGGLRLGLSSITEHFQRCMKTSGYVITSIDKLIGMNINDTLARHLMVITKGESVLGIIEQHLCQLKRERTETIFGSQFEEDLTDDYNYRILSKIILCMEQGIVLILKDLENIYGSLYDMLNQNYTRIGKKNICRVALGPYSNPFCHVAESFRCIVLVDENNLDYSDPPFLNRFEKQYLTFSDVLNPEQHDAVRGMKSWVRKLTSIDEMPFSEYNAFPYYNEELLVSLVLFNENHVDRCKHDLLWLLKPEVILRLEKVSDTKIIDSRFDLREEYFALPIHEGLGHFINYQIHHIDELLPNRCTVIFTNSNIHAKISGEMSQWRHQSEKIGAFKSEKQLSITLKHFWDTDSEILLVHCNAEEDGKHLMLTKSVIEKSIAKYNNTVNRSKLVYIIVHLNGRDLYQKFTSSSNENALGAISQVNFLSGCKLVMLDNLERPRQPLPSLCSYTLFEIIDCLVKKADILKNEIFWAFTRIKFGEQSRDVNSIKDVLNKIKDSELFLSHLASLVCTYLETTIQPDEDESWCISVACDIQALNRCTNFVNALEEHVKNVVKKTLAKFIFKMELMGILDCFFTDDTHMYGRRSLWLSLVSDKRYFCIDDVADPSGPECFFCDTTDIALSMPFSKIVFNAVERTKDTFMDGVIRAKIKCEIEADEELPAEVMDEIKLQHEAFIAPAVSEYMVEHSIDTYSSLGEDYSVDFFNLFSNNLVSHLNRASRISYTEWLFSQKLPIKGESDKLPVIISNLHCCGWIHCSTITPALQLVELCSDIFDKPLTKSWTVTPVSSIEEFSSANVTNGQEADTSVDTDSNGTNDSNYENNPENEDDYEGIALLKDGSSKTGHIVEDLPSETVMYDSNNSLNENLSQIGNEELNESQEGGDLLMADHGKQEDSLINEESSKNNYKKSEVHLSDQKGTVYYQKVSDIIASVDDLEVFVSIVSHEMLMKFAKGASEKWLLATRNFISLATEVSDVENLHKLRFCNDVTVYFLEPHGLNVNALEPLGAILQDTDIDSDAVFKELIRLFTTTSKEYIAETKSRTVSQYFFRCISSNDETVAYRFLFQVINDDIVPENECELLRSPLNTCMDTGEAFDDILLNDVYGDQSVEMDDNSFLSQLNVCLQNLHLQNRQDGPFTLMIVDLLQVSIDLPDGSDEFANLMTKAGMVLQKERFSLLFVTAVAFLKSAIENVAQRVAQNKDERGSLLKTVNAVIAGLEDVPFGNSVKAFFLKTLGQWRPLHDIMKSCDDLPCMTDVKWLKQFWPKLLEYNPLAIHLPEQALRKAELLMLPTDSFEKNMDALKDIVHQDICHGKLLVFALAMSEYYTRRYREMLDDTLKRQATEFLNVVQTDTPYDESILHFLTGKQNLANGTFELNEQTSFQQYMINTTLVSFYCLMLSKWNDKSMTKNSLLLKCLFTPSEIQTLCIPGVATMQTDQRQNKQEGTLALCSCNYRLVFNGSGSLRCCVCKKEIQVDECPSNQHTLQTETIHTGYSCKDTEWSTECTTFAGNMTPLSFHVLHFLIKGAMLGSLAFGSSNAQMMEEVLSVSEIDVFRFLENQVICHWENIGNLSNLNEYGIGQFMHTVFMSSDSILFKNCCSFDSLNATKEWEDLFNKHVSRITTNGFSTSDERHKVCCKIYDLPDVSVEAQIREVDTIENQSVSERLQLLPTMFRLAKEPTRSNFMCWLSTSGDKYPFLIKVLQCEEDLKLPIHLYNIVQWHVMTCIKISYSMKRWQCSDMSVREFIEKQRSKSLVKKMFKAFRTSVITLKKQLAEEEFSYMPSLNENSKLLDCVMLDEECWLFKVLSKLVQIQNEFIDFSLAQSFKCKNLQFLVRADDSACFRCIRVTELKTENLINMKMDETQFDDILRENSCAELAYGKGHVIKYDFHNIEKDLVYDLLIEGRRAYIKQTGLQFIVFKDELYRTFVSLLKEVCQSVPQEALPVDLVVQIKKNSNEMPNMANEMINSLDMIFTLLKRTKCDQQMPLVEYIQTFSNMIGQDFPKSYLPNPEGRLKVCHVVSYHEVLEEICADQVIGSLEEKYEAELSDKLLEHFRNMASGSLVKAETVAGTLRRFIYRCVYMCKTTPEQQLLKFMNEASFWKESAMVDGKVKLDGKTEDIADVIPDEAQVCHVVHIVQLLNESIETQRQGDMRIDYVITSWKNKQPSSVKPKQASKVTKKLKKR